MIAILQILVHNHHQRKHCFLILLLENELDSIYGFCITEIERPNCLLSSSHCSASLVTGTPVHVVVFVIEDGHRAWVPCCHITHGTSLLTPRLGIFCTAVWSDNLFLSMMTTEVYPDLSDNSPYFLQTIHVIIIVNICQNIKRSLFYVFEYSYDKRILSETEIKFLSKGLKYTPTPRIDNQQLKTDIRE